MRVVWALLGLWLLACQPPGTEAPPLEPPPVVAESAPEAGAPAPAESALPSATASGTSSAQSPVPDICPTDTHRQWTCGRPAGRSPGEAGKPVAVSDCPADGVNIDHSWRMVSFPGVMHPDTARTQAFRQRVKDDSGRAVHDVCCYSACVPVEVRKTADPPPKDHDQPPLCISAFDSPASIPAPGRPDCAAAVRIPGYREFGAYSPAATALNSEATAARAGFADAKVCCYNGLQPTRITR